MFTGIIEEIGHIKNITNDSITITANVVLHETKIGDSIATNGTCLTVTNITNNSFKASVMPETFNKTNLGGLKNGDAVNLERAATIKSRLGGHIVLGHVDGVGVIQNIKNDNSAIWYTIKTTGDILPYIAKKGSVALDGVSLTIVDVDDEKQIFTVSTIPHTRNMTILGKKILYDKVNIECDIIARYILRTTTLALMEGTKNPPGLITSKLIKDVSFIQNNNYVTKEVEKNNKFIEYLNQ